MEKMLPFSYLEHDFEVPFSLEGATVSLLQVAVSRASLPGVHPWMTLSFFFVPISPLLFCSTFLTQTLLTFYPSPLSQATYFPPFSSRLRQKAAWYVRKVLRQNREQGRVWGLCGPLSSGLMASCMYHCSHRIAFRGCAFPFCFVQQSPDSLSAIPSPNTAAPDLTL